MQDPLQLLPVEKWPELQKVFKSDWPRGMSAYYTLETQRRWFEQGFHYGFKVYCPYGDLWNGMVAFCEKKGVCEIMIRCPRDDTEKLEEALRRTKLINWRRTIMVPSAPDQIMDCINRIKQDIGVKIKHSIPSLLYILDKNTLRFDDVRLPLGITFDQLTEDHVELVNTKWPHRYPGSDWYFYQLINSKSGYGLFQNENLIAWVFVNETGALGHLYVLEEYRRKGFAELILKMLCNILLEDGKDVLVFCVKENQTACNLYKKLNFAPPHDVTWLYLDKNN